MTLSLVKARARPDSYFDPQHKEDRNVNVISKGLDARGIKHEREVPMRGTQANGRIDLVVELTPLLVGFEAKQYDLGGPRLIADGIAQSADYARAVISAGTWQGRHLDFVFVGPVPNSHAQGYHYVPAEMLSRYTAPMGVGTFDQQMYVYAFGTEAVRFLSDGFKFCFNFDQIQKHKREFRR